MKISLSRFCEIYKLPKSSVHRRCRDLNIDTAEGISESDGDRILVEFGKKATASRAPKDVAAEGLAIIPVVHRAEVVPANSDLVARRIQPQVISYDTSELTVATQLNAETVDFNVNAMGQQLIEQMRQMGRLHGAQARQAYAHEVAKEMQMGLQ